MLLERCSAANVLHFHPRASSIQSHKLLSSRAMSLSSIYQGVELLDFAGPGEVFAAAMTIEGQRAFNVFTVAVTSDPIVSQGFVKVNSQYTIDNCPRPDIVVLPRGNAISVIRDDKAMAWIKNTTNESEITMSVCTGAYLLARNGLLNDKKATTHWASINELKKEAPSVTVLENTRFVDNGQILTTAGVSAGIDGALHIVDRLLSRPAAQLTARYMEYEWNPSRKINTSLKQRTFHNLMDGVWPKSSNQPGV